MSYKTDKKGIVRFGNGRKKTQLHNYISGLARKLAFKIGGSQFDHKRFLIKYYDKDGLIGVNRVMKIKLKE